MYGTVVSHTGGMVVRIGSMICKDEKGNEN